MHRVALKQVQSNVKQHNMDYVLTAVSAFFYRHYNEIAIPMFFITQETYFPHDEIPSSDFNFAKTRKHKDFQMISRMFSMRLRCSIPVDIIYIRVVFMLLCPKTSASFAMSFSMQ